MKLTTRDLINVGVFSAIYFVILFGLGMLGFLGPLVMFVGHAVAIIANGAVIALYLARVPRLGAFTLLMAVISVLMVLTGHVWYQLLIGPALGLAADLVARVRDYRSPVANTIGYALMSLWYAVPLMPVIWDSKGYFEFIASTMGQDYADEFARIFNSTTLLWWSVAIVILALIGGWFGQSMLRRHFARSCLTK